LLSVAASLMVALAAPMAFANQPPIDDKKEEENGDKKGGNATDKATTPSATAKPAATNQTSRPPINYTKESVEFWGLFLSSGDPFAGALEAADVGRWTAAPSSLEVVTSPPDAPAESVLDQLDESQAPLPMVGEPGSEVTVAAEAPTPPPESVLDYIDSAPAPQPAVSTTQEASKPAVNQAPKPAVAETPPQ
jgi:hypothetical protein